MLRLLIAATSLAWTFALLATTTASAQDIGEALCGDCKTTGRVAHEHKAKDLELEAEEIEYCSFFMRTNEDVLGMDWVICAKCRTPSVQASAKEDFDSEFGRRKKWLDERESEADQPAGHRVEHIKTRHFLISFDLPKIKVKRKAYNTHQAIHLYAERLEELHAQMLMLHGITESSTSRQVHRIYIFERDLTAKRVGNHVMSAGMGSGFRKTQYGPASVHITNRDRKTLRKDEQFHQALVHSVSHIITNEIGILKKWLTKRYGWVNVGMAHWFEVHNFGPPITWCHQEQGAFMHWKSKSWEANVKKELLAGNAINFQEILGKSSETLDARAHQFSWSYVDYLMWLDPNKMVKFLTLIKGPQLPERDALRQAYGITIGQFVEGWEEFVRTKYSMRPWKGPRVLPPRQPVEEPESYGQR